jgi:hypothetical protein
MLGRQTMMTVKAKKTVRWKMPIRPAGIRGAALTTVPHPIPIMITDDDCLVHNEYIFKAKVLPIEDNDFSIVYHFTQPFCLPANAAQLSQTAGQTQRLLHDGV